VVTARWIFAGLLVVYIVAGLWTTGRANATGDEPYYFMAADSLLRGEALELTARWRELVGASYDPGAPVTEADFVRQSAPSLTRAGRYPLHDPGLSLLIAIPFGAGGRALVVVVSALAMAAALAVAYRAAVGYGIGQRPAVVATVLTGLAAPAITYSGQTFPDAIAPLPIALALGAAFGVVPIRPIGLALAALPLLHVRYWPLALGLLGLIVVTRRPRRRIVLAVLAPLAVAAGALAIVGLAIYGVPLPHASFVSFFLAGEQVGAYTRASGAGLIGLFADRTFGLLPAAPVFALAFVGAGIAARDDRSRALLAATLPYVAVVALLDWTGAYSPQARYLAPLVPVLAVLLATALGHRAVRIAAVPLVLLTLVQSAIYVVAPELRYGRAGFEPLADLAWAPLGIRPSALFPLITQSGSWPAATAWAGLLAGLVALGSFHFGAVRHDSVTGDREGGGVWGRSRRST